MYPVISDGERETIDTYTIDGIGGEVATVAETPTVRARAAAEMATEDGFGALQEMPVRDLLDRIADAGRRFQGIGPQDELGPVDAYADTVARATGLPVGWVTVANHWLGYSMRHAAEALRAQSPTGGLDVYDDPAYDRETTVGLAFAPAVRSLGAVMPANDPTVYGWPALALAMKLPIVLRPARREPFTAIRLARALLAAGVPPAAVHVLPGDRTVGETVLSACEGGMAFGGESVVGRYGEDPTVQTYGPGRSVAVLGHQPDDRTLATLARGVTRSGGRACFNLSRIVTLPSVDADAVAQGLAERIAGATDGPPTNHDTDVSAFPDIDRAEMIDDRADAAGEDVTADYRQGPRLSRHGDHARLAPTVVRGDDLAPELPFQFVGVTEAPTSDPDDLLVALDGPYLAVPVGAPEIERAMVRSPVVSKVYAEQYPAAVDLRETHERFLANDFYAVTTYDPG